MYVYVPLTLGTVIERLFIVHDTLLSAELPSDQQYSLGFLRENITSYVPAFVAVCVPL